jgi:hypothetical protein
LHASEFRELRFSQRIFDPREFPNTVPSPTTARGFIFARLLRMIFSASVTTERQKSGERFLRHFPDQRPLGGQFYISNSRDVPRTIDLLAAATPEPGLRCGTIGRLNLARATNAASL